MLAFSRMSRSLVNDLEHLLRRHKSQLCAGAAVRYRASLLSGGIPAHNPDWSGAGAALHPSDVTLRQQFRWASTGLLRQYGIGYDQHQAMLRAYFDGAREILNPAHGKAISTLEQFIAGILAEIFRLDAC